MKKVTGIGGIFFKCKDPQAIKEWYKTHLGLNVNDYGATFEPEEDSKGSLSWSPFPESTTYFQPSEYPFMINYIVDNLEQLVQELKQADVGILDEISSYEYGKFIHILDPEGHKIELWEPVK
ncbi:VOC family protein [Chryseobacterium camelliae]|uniref:VOC family protein n=1 Tax=Chryseobacterium camelliae TaxID=1265445 RepID=UPI000C1C9A75|nr:VOC family protein [Chryseobacterium camelliae]